MNGMSQTGSEAALRTWHIWSLREQLCLEKGGFMRTEKALGRSLFQQPRRVTRTSLILTGSSPIMRTEENLYME